MNQLRGIKWTKQEEELLKRKYPQNNKEELLRLFPNRTWKSIEKKKLKLKLKKIWSKDWTDKEISFLKKNIHKGKQKCVLYLNKSIPIINKKIKELGINQSISIDKFKNINTKEMAYVLGLIWSDGYLTIVKNSYSISIQMILKDMKSIKKYFLKTGKWNFYVRHRENRQVQGVLSITNKNFGLYLKDCDYKEKSYKSADKILKNIPPELKHYFFLGVLDGDGSWINNKSGSKQFKLASTFEQDWSYFEYILKEMNIKYTIERNVYLNKKNNKINKHSVVRISNRDGINKLGKYIYQTYEDDKIGLPRKFQSFKKNLKSI